MLGPGSGHSLSGMSARIVRDDQFRHAIWRQARPFLLGILPVPDLPSRLRVRWLAASLAGRGPWPGRAATSDDAAKLALLRLRWLQHETRRAVRSRQAEAATMLARVSIETLITGLYCLHEQGAVAKLQAENVRNLSLLLKFMTDAGIIPGSVLDECIRRLDYGQPARGLPVEGMAAFVDKSLGVHEVVGLYDRFYRPSSTLALHGGGLALLRHVREDDRLSRKPARTWARRSPARIVDACLGVLTANMARRVGNPSHVADEFAKRHYSRALPPIITISSTGIGKVLMRRQILNAALTLRYLFRYTRSDQDAADPAVRIARIRSGMEAILLAGVADLPEGALDPFLDYVSEKIAAGAAPENNEAPV